MKYRSKDLAELTLRTRTDINYIARKLGIKRAGKEFEFTEEQKRAILEKLKFPKNAINAFKENPDSLLVVYSSPKGEITFKRYLTLERAKEITGDAISSWGDNITKKRNGHYSPLCEGVYFGRNYVLVEDVIKFARIPKGVTIEEIARETGISKKTIYNYRNKGIFTSKKRANHRNSLTPEDVEKIKAEYEKNKPKKETSVTLKNLNLNLIASEISRGRNVQELFYFCKFLQDAIQRKPLLPQEYLDLYHLSEEHHLSLNYLLWCSQNLSSVGEPGRRKIAKFVSRLEQALHPQGI